MMPFLWILGTFPHLHKIVVDEVASALIPDGPAPGTASRVRDNTTGLGSDDPKSLYACNKTSYNVNSSKSFKIRWSIENSFYGIYWISFHGTLFSIQQFDSNITVLLNTIMNALLNSGMSQQ